MNITKDSPEWLAALTLVPEKWIDGPCHIMNCGHPESKHPVVGWAARVPHNMPPPSITPDLLYAIRRAIEARGYLWTLRYWNKGPGREYEFAINDGMKLIGWAVGSTEDKAIIRAVTSLPEL